MEPFCTYAVSQVPVVLREGFFCLPTALPMLSLLWDRNGGRALLGFVIELRAWFDFVRLMISDGNSLWAEVARFRNMAFQGLIRNLDYEHYHLSI